MPDPRTSGDLPREAPAHQPKPVAAQASKNNGALTDKAFLVNRVAKRLGWVSYDDPEKTIRFLSAEAEQMKENVYQYLESLAKLGQAFCHEKNPECAKCPMNGGCAYRNSTGKKVGILAR